MENFLQFSKRPVNTTQYEKFKFIIIFQFFILFIIFSGLSAGISFILTSIFNLTNKADTLPYFEMVVRGVLIAPIFEEIIFRMILKERKVNYHIFGIFSILYILAGIYFKHWNTAIIVTGIFIIGITVGILNFRRIITIYSNKNYKYLYYGSILIFGLVHISNYPTTNYYFYIFAPLMVLPQIGSGFLLSYVRVKYGIQYSIFFHFLINLPIVLGKM